MIHRLRRRHRRIWLVLAWLVPLLYGVAIWRRPAPPREESLPATLLYDLLESRQLQERSREVPGTGEER